MIPEMQNTASLTKHATRGGSSNPVPQNLEDKEKGGNIATRMSYHWGIGTCGERGLGFEGRLLTAKKNQNTCKLVSGSLTHGTRITPTPDGSPPGLKPAEGKRMTAAAAAAEGFEVTHFASVGLCATLGGGRGLGARGRRVAAGSGAAGEGEEDRSGRSSCCFSIIFLETPRTRLLGVTFFSLLLVLIDFIFPEKKEKGDSSNKCLEAYSKFILYNYICVIH
jgi:hypothetical protein